ncbi:ATP-binding cassette domain-containing protein [Pseudoxanthobacter sp.]|uniref:ATP-binding cassette domain-containing protein n=1 Tax=Pseudoxanthobacter sp. TaxID=1925742 RepID=UPI002FE2D84B
MTDVPEFMPLPAGVLTPLAPAIPCTLVGASADLYLASGETDARRFVATIPEGALLPEAVPGFELFLRPRLDAGLEAGGDSEGALLWTAALARAAAPGGIAVPEPEDEASFGAISHRLLAAIAARLAAAERSAEDERSTQAQRMESAFTDTLKGFGRVLDGTFHRPPAGSRTPLAAAAARLAEMLHVRAVPVREEPGEDREDFLERFAAGHGLRLRRIGLGTGTLPEGEGALLAFDGDGRPWVLRARRRGGFVIEHPTDAEPPRRLGRDDRAAFGNDAYMFFRTLPGTRLTYRSIFGFGLRDSVWDFVLLGFCGLAGALLALLPPLASAQIANIAVHTADVPFLIELLLVLAMALVAETTFFVVGRLAELRANGRAGLALHAAMVDRLLRLTPASLRSSTTLILATEMETVEKFRRALLGFVTNGAVALLNGLAAAVVVTFVSPVAGLVSIGLVLSLLAITAFLGWAQFRAIYEGERMDVIVLAFVYDLVRLVPVVRGMRMEKRAFTQWGENFLAFQSRLMRSARISNRLSVIEPGWDAIVLALSFAAIAYAGSTASIGAGQAIVFVLALGRLTQSGKELSHHLIGASKLMPMAKLARPLIEFELEPPASGAPAVVLSSRLDVSDVSFFHGTRRILQGVNLTVREGEFVGLVGPSGSGKSTLLSLLAGLEKPDSGRILLGGHDLAGLDRRQISRRIGLVMQGARLLPASIYENIRGVGDITIDEAWAFAEQAAIADELRALPMGLLTIVGEGGAGLAEGQIQRLLIARALARRPSVILLDESMSALDGVSKDRILASLAKLDLTRILVTHHPAALKRVDRLVMMHEGSVVEIAPPDDVAGAGGKTR